MVQRSALPLSKGKNYKVVTLCGSTRFKEQYMEVQKRLTLEGYIVISVGLFGHSGDEEVWKPGTKEMLDDMHLRKIDMADEIFVINVGGYIGESTKREIAYAEKTGKKVNYLEKECGTGEAGLRNGVCPLCPVCGEQAAVDVPRSQERGRQGEAAGVLQPRVVRNGSDVHHLQHPPRRGVGALGRQASWRHRHCHCRGASVSGCH